MKPLSYLNYMRLSMLANPVCDRDIYRLIRKNRFRSLIEIGMEDGHRCQNMIRVAQKYGASGVKYTGVDLFEAREETQKQLQLIEMYRKLKSLDAKTQLVPGDLYQAITRIANSLVRTDLIVISHGFDEELLEACWFYFPRMLYSRSVVLIQKSAGAAFETLTRHQIEKLASKRVPSRSVAA